MRNDEVFNRLQKLINYKPMQKEIAEKTGINQNTLSAKATRNSNWKDSEIQKLNTAYNIDIYKEISQNFTKEECISIPVRGEVTASMGYGVTVYDESQTGTYDISRRLLQDLGVSKNTSEIIFGTGNSMEPTIQGGDALLIDLSRKEINDGKVYCIRYEGKLLTKRLQKLSRSKVKIISDNKDYEPIILDLDKENYIDFSVIGEIRWAGRIFR